MNPLTAFGAFDGIRCRAAACGPLRAPAFAILIMNMKGERKMRFWNRYDQLFFRRLLKESMLICAIPAVPIMIVSLFYNVYPYDLLWGVLLFVVSESAILIIWFLSLPLREHRLLKAQAELGLIFPNAPMERLAHEPTYFADPDWIVLAGKVIFHRSILRSVTVRRTSTKIGGGNYQYTVVFLCESGESCRVKVYCSSAAEAVRKWYRQGDGKGIEV